MLKNAIQFVYDELNDMSKCFRILWSRGLSLKEDNSRYFSIDPGLNIVAVYNNVELEPLHTTADRLKV